MRLIPPHEADAPYTVSGLNRTISEILSEDGGLVWVEAEISSLKRHSSGHCYLRLIDRNSQIPAVLWKSYATQLPADITEGDHVEVIAQVRVYERGGYYQLDIRKIMKAGEGEQQRRLEELKQRLFEEGLFAESAKKKLPRSIQKVAVITAETGAAFYDITNVIARNAPQLDVLLIPAVVQGSEAPKSLVNALKQIEAYGDADVLIFGRGGGSAEDLACFNDESVVRALFSCSIPTISAVGHEVDVSLSDLVADIRAATPSAAAEIVISSRIGDSGRLDELQRRFIYLAKQRISEPFRQVNRTWRRSLFQQVINRVVDNSQSVDYSEQGLYRRISTAYQRKHQQVINKSEQLNNLSPLTLLSRGYAVVQNQQGDQIHSIDSVALYDELSLRLSDGTLFASVTGKTLFEQDNQQKEQ